ncbi:hypothetical protein ACQJBY_021933 [Aegilops geniculata]
MCFALTQTVYIYDPPINCSHHSQLHRSHHSQLAPQSPFPTRTAVTIPNSFACVTPSSHPRVSLCSQHTKMSKTIFLFLWIELTGRIPLDFNNLNSGVLNLSRNKLTGEMPPSLQIAAYELSFLANSGLCAEQGTEINLLACRGLVIMDDVAMHGVAMPTCQKIYLRALFGTKATVGKEGAPVAQKQVRCLLFVTPSVQK